GDDGHAVHVEAVIDPRHHDGVALAHGLLVERQAGGVVGDRIDALLGQRGNLGGGLDVDPCHLALGDPVELGGGGGDLAPPGAGMVLPSRSLGFVIGASFRLHTLSGVLSKTMPTTLTLAPRATAAMTTALSARPMSARPVSTLAMESPEPLEFCGSTSRPLAL